MISLLQQTAADAVHQTETQAVEAAGHGAEAAHAAAGAADHAASAPGMPQLDFSTFGNQIFWLLVVLAVIYWVLSRIALPRIGGVISDRQGAITGDLMAEYKVSEDFTVKANVSNVTNKRYADSLYANGHYVPGAGRLIQVTGSLKF